MAKNVTPNLLMMCCLAAVAKSATFKTKWLDTQLGEGYGFDIQVGANTGTAADANNKVVITMEDSADTADADGVAVAAANLLYLPITLDANGKYGTCYRAEYKGYKRYVRLVFTWTGTPAAIIGVTGLLGTLRSAPAGAPIAGVTAT